MRKVICSTLFALLGIITSPIVHAQEDDDPDDNAGVELSVSTAERSQLQALLDREPAPGMSGLNLWNFYDSQDSAAQRLGDVARELMLLPKWLASAGDNQQLKLKPLWRLWRANVIGGDIALGLNYGNELLPQVSSDTNPLYRVRMLAALARDYVNLMDRARAEDLLGKAEEELARDMSRKSKPLRVFRRLRGQAFILSARCWLLTRQGKHAEAETAARQELAVTEKAMALGRSLDLSENAYLFHVTALEDLMRTQTDQGHLIDAATTAQTMLSFLKENQLAGSNLTGAYLRIAELKLAQNDARRAEFYARAALRNAHGSADASFGTRAIAAYRHLIDVMIVRRAWADALALQHQLDAGVAGNEVAARLAFHALQRGTVLANSGQAQQAQALLKKSLDFHVQQLGPRHIDTILTGGVYGIALAKGGQKELARPLLETAMRNMHAPDIAGAGMADRGVHRTYGQLILEEYIALLSERATDPAAVDEAFRAAEYLRGSVVQQSVVDSAVRAAAGIAGLGDLVRAEQDMKNEITALQNFLARQLAEPPQRQLPGVVEQMRKRIDALQADMSARHRSITQRFPEYDALIHPQPPSIAAVRKRLAPDEAFVSMLPLPSGVAVFTVSAEGATLTMAGMAPTQLNALVARLRTTLDIGELDARAAPAFDADAAYRLYDTLLAPAASIWKGKSRLVVAAGGSLGQLPFGVLLTAPATPGARMNDTALRGAPWLIAQASVSHVPSVSSWAALRDAVMLAKDSRTERKPFFGFGDPLFNAAQAAAHGSVRKVMNARPADDAELVPVAQYDRLPPLPETRDEIIAIANALGADPQRDALFGKDASRRNVLSADLRNRQVIAFATHGLIPGDLPHLSQPALALAATGSDKESPLLTLEDVLNLKLNADWVVLSACNTAAADGQASEAISGLGRGFFYAGAKALLVTHWAVESQSAKDLTTATFKRFGADSRMSRAEALRQAQLEVMKTPGYAHPFFWAPYALIGEGGR